MRQGILNKFNYFYPARTKRVDVLLDQRRMNAESKFKG